MRREGGSSGGRKGEDMREGRRRANVGRLAEGGIFVSTYI